MLAKIQNGFFLFVGVLLLLAAGGFASIACNGTSIICKDTTTYYLPLINGPTFGRDVGLYVEDEHHNKLPNTPVYIYSPNAGKESAYFTLRGADFPHDNSAILKNGDHFISDASTAEVRIWAWGVRPATDIVLGTAVSDLMEPVYVKFIFNFYAPMIRFCKDVDCDTVITDVSEIQLNVGESMPVYVQAVVPMGPDSGKVDAKIDTMEYLISGANENLHFLNNAGVPLGTVDVNGETMLYSKIINGKSSFIISSDKAIDVDFTLNTSPLPLKDGTYEFRTSADFPNAVQFVNYGLPTLDSAFIYDTDGDGVGDSIAAYFNGQMNGVSLENYEYNWPTGGGYTAFSGEVTPPDHQVGLSGVKTTIPDSSGKGSLRVHASSSVSGADGTLSTAIQDRIGPVIQTATLEPGDGEFDYVILSFNKPLDERWTSGYGFLLDGVPLSMEAVEKGVGGDDRVWKFKVPKNSVKEGHEIEIATSCAKDKCPDGLIKAADGNKTGKNNPVKISNSGKNYVDDERNGFYDKDGDGRMDSATVAFKEPISKKDLEEMEVVLYWLDNQGNVLEIRPDLTDTNFVKLSKDGLMLSITVDSTKFDVQRMLTYVDTAGIDVDSLKYGFAKVTKPVVQADGSTKMETYDCTMHDRMSPVIAGTFLEPESFQKMEADVLTISFSEPVDRSALEDLAALSDCFKFKVDGQWVSIPFSSLEWSKDGKSVKLHLQNGIPLAERLNPADSLKFDFEKAGIKDMDGNGVSPKSQPVMVKGDPRVLMQSTSLATLDRAVLLADRAAFTEKFVNADDPMDDEMKKSLGILMDISFATVMEEDSSGVDKMNLDDVGLSWELKVFTNLGAYVGGASNKVKCSDKKAFDGNCFEHAKKMYVRWNMRSSEGRKVGVGVYVAQFKINVYGAKNSFKVERIYNWGIRAGKGGLGLGD